MAKRGSRRPLVLALLMLLTVILYFQMPNNSDPKSEHYSLDKTGAGTIVDFTKVSRQIHGEVDEVLAKAGLAARDRKETAREVPRQGVEGQIRWHSRQMMVTLPADKTLEGFQQDMIASVQKAGGQLLTSQPEDYQGQPVIRLDIGLREKLEGEQLTIVTDTIYVGKEKGITSQSKPNASSTVRGKLAIIIDDFGYNQEPIAAFAAIDRPLTFAVLPYRPYSNEAAARGLAAGHQIMLHLPMEPLNAGEQTEEKTITVNMSDTDIQAFVAKAVQAVPGISGVNNHQGSRATADQRVMRNVLKIIKGNHLFFIDSRTSSQSVAYELAGHLGVRTGQNSLFLDNDNDIAAIKKQLRAAAAIAIKHGEAIVIGHARLYTAIAVREMIPELEAGGIKLMLASQALK